MSHFPAGTFRDVKRLPKIRLDAKVGSFWHVHRQMTCAYVLRAFVRPTTGVSLVPLEFCHIRQGDWF